VKRSLLTATLLLSLLLSSLLLLLFLLLSLVPNLVSFEEEEEEEEEETEAPGMDLLFFYSMPLVACLAAPSSLSATIARWSAIPLSCLGLVRSA
jgi:hypothetical protein